MRTDMGDVFIEVDVPGRDRERVATYPSGRVCGHDGCRVVLSIYNSDDFCSVHSFEAGPALGPSGTRRAPTMRHRPRRTAKATACAA